MVFGSTSEVGSEMGPITSVGGPRRSLGEMGALKGWAFSTAKRFPNWCDRKALGGEVVEAST